MSQPWIEMSVADGSRVWKCTACGLVVGGEPVKRPPGHCAICAARAGAVVAVAADRSRRLSMMVLDGELADLIAAYRSAKAEHGRDVEAQSRIDDLGNYGLDDAGGGAATEASASNEQRSAFALADATSQRMRTSRAPTPTPTRQSRTSHPH